ncbi:ABC transporter permease [Actinocatenispora sera]|uniref:ABC transporter permease n=1 Tax=Actinocatenispora sera TaxID=390989 RepID=UPI0033FB182C
MGDGVEATATGRSGSPRAAGGYGPGSPAGTAVAAEPYPPLGPEPAAGAYPPLAAGTADLAGLAQRYGLAVSGARPSLADYARQVWGRRHFIRTFASSKLAAQYTTARLGQVWQVVTPLINAAVYFLIFGVLLGTHRGIDNYIAYLCVGVFLFNFTQQAVQAGTRSIPNNLTLIRALHFPRASLPVAATISQLQQLVLSMLVLSGIVLVTGEPLTWRWLLILPSILLQTIFNAGLVMIVARLAAKTTDLAQLVPFVMRVWMYLSGVFYSTGVVAAHAPHLVVTALNWNPAYVFISLMRHSLMTSVPAHDLPGHLWVKAAAWALIVGAGGFAFFWHAEEEYGRG